jgi:RNA polymerase sigma-70 factor (ECF subfamily)
MREHAECSDGDLLRRMQAGDEEAFIAIYRRHQGGIYRFAFHMTGSPEIAEEVTQEVFMTLIRHHEQFDPLKGSLQAFLFGIGRNHVLRYFERERDYVSLDSNDFDGSYVSSDNLEAVAADPLSELTREEAVTQVWDAVMSLPAIYREVVVLCELQEMSYAEAAQLLACAVGTVRSRLHRARSLLLTKLKALRKVSSGLNS